MNTATIKKYAPQARQDFIKAVTARAARFGMTPKKIDPAKVEGDVALIAGEAFPKVVADQRAKLEARIERDGFDQAMEAIAYTWFNRFVAIRFMELHGYLEHGYRVLSHPEGSATPEILEHAQHVDLPGLDQEQVVELKLEGTKDEQLYRLLLIAQCNALHKAMPFLFEQVQDETELLLPDNLLHTGSLIRTLVETIPANDWQHVEIIGWLYQFYISQKKDQVIGKVVKSEDIPAATQLFTPNWIVQYLVQNSIGRQWLATYPDSSLKAQMDYYIEPAEQPPEVQAQLNEITPRALDPERMTLLDPACGSGHILVEAYDLFKAIYQERGYRARDIPRLILHNNLFGLEIDERAAQLAAFALLMKARADDRRLLEGGIRLNVHCIRSSDGLDAEAVYDALVHGLDGDAGDAAPTGEFEFMEEVHSPLMAEAKKDRAAVAEDLEHPGFTADDIRVLLNLFEGDKAKTFGSLIRIPEGLAAKLPEMVERTDRVAHDGDFYRRRVAEQFLPIAEQASLLAGKYGAAVANPPYMGRKYLCNDLYNYLIHEYPAYASDLYASMICRCVELTASAGHTCMITMDSWMFGNDLREARSDLTSKTTILANAHLGPRAFDEISGEVVQTCAFSLQRIHVHNFITTFFRLTAPKTSEGKRLLLLNREMKYEVAVDYFAAFPRQAMAYYASDMTRLIFLNGEELAQYAEAFTGLQTGDNNSFIRLWAEVDVAQIGFGLSRSEVIKSGTRWFPYVKGSEYRKWYGNLSFVVDWASDGTSIRSHPSSTVRNSEHYFSPGLAYNNISKSFCARLVRGGAIFDQKNSMFIASNDRFLLPVLGFLHSKVVAPLLEVVAHKDFNPGSLKVLPVDPDVFENPSLMSAVSELVALAEEDWNSSEIAWDYGGHPWLSRHCPAVLVECWNEWQHRCAERHKRTSELEAAVNKIFINAYGLQDTLSPEVSDDQVTLRQPTQAEDVGRLLSYAIGCLMGRYSLDKPGLIYAHSGNEGFDPSQYQTFPADGDGIVPITDIDWFEDDAANRVMQFIETAWPAEHLEENLDFVADSLKRKKSESARDTIRRYLSQQFFKDHLQTYKRRPIYWLFSSGKQRAFQALVYLHRYNAGTLSRMRTEYVIPLQGRLDARLDRLAEEIESATSTSRRRKLEKERETLQKQQAELLKFDEKLKHHADQRIELDLDDGVKANYGKFGDLLAEVKAVTGKKAEAG